MIEVPNKNGQQEFELRLAEMAALLPEEYRERFLLRMAAAGFAPNDPVLAVQEMNAVLVYAQYRVMEKVIAANRQMASLSADIARFQEAIGAVLDMMKEQIKQDLNAATEETKQLLEDVRLQMMEAVTSERMGKLFGREIHQQFAVLIHEQIDSQRSATEKQLLRATELVTTKLNAWLEKSLKDALNRNQAAMESATTNFKIKLYGQWAWLLWAMASSGIVAAIGLFLAGYFVGRR